MPPYFSKPTKVKIFHLSVLALTYGLAFAFFPFIARDQVTYTYFSETYFGGVAASMVLSAISLLVRPGRWLYSLLCLRCYFLIILGYSIAGVLSSKLILGIALMVEIGLLVEFQVELVQKPVQNRGHEDGDHRQEGDPAVKCVERGEELGRGNSEAGADCGFGGD